MAWEAAGETWVTIRYGIYSDDEFLWEINLAWKAQQAEVCLIMEASATMRDFACFYVTSFR